MDVLHRLNQLSGFFEKSAAGRALTRQALEQEERARLETRAADVATVARVSAELEREIAHAAPAAAKLLAAEEALRAQLAAAIQKRASLEAARRRRIFEQDRVIEQCRTRLERSANMSLINSFLESLHAQVAAVQYDHAEARTIDGKSREVWNNYPSVARFIAASVAARQAALGLRYEAIDNEQLASRLIGLQEALPPVEARPDSLCERFVLIGQNLAALPLPPPWRPELSEYAGAR